MFLQKRQHIVQSISISIQYSPFGLSPYIPSCSTLTQVILHVLSSTYCVHCTPYFSSLLSLSFYILSQMLYVLIPFYPSLTNTSSDNVLYIPFILFVFSCTVCVHQAII
eukprot:60272_1